MMQSSINVARARRQVVAALGVALLSGALFAPSALAAGTHHHQQDTQGQNWSGNHHSGGGVHPYIVVDPTDF